MNELGAEERIRRVQNCYKRFEDMLESFKLTARGCNHEDWDTLENRQELPFARKWWQFFINMQTDKVLPLLMESMPEAVKVILGGPLNTIELLMLPVVGNDCRLWGVYTDIMTNIDRIEVARYVGSGTAKDGIQSRLKIYPAIARGTKKSGKGRHADWLRREDVQMNLRVAAVFNQCTTSKPYVLLMEPCNTVLLQTLALEEPFEYCTTATGEMIREAMPRDLPKANHKPLNRAAQCWQGLWFRRRDGSEVCANYGATATSKGRWYSATSGLPFCAVICGNCYKYSMDHPGEQRPAKLERNRTLEKPAKGEACPGCLKVHRKMRWYWPENKHSREEPLNEPGRQRWECWSCHYKPTAQLPVNKPPPEWKCDVCGKFLISAGLLNQHIKCHIKPFACDTCSRTFSTKIAMRNHML